MNDDFIHRDLRPEASELFIAGLQRNLDKVMRYANLAVLAGTPVYFHYSEHASSRGIKLLTMGEK